MKPYWEFSASTIRVFRVTLGLLLLAGSGSAFALYRAGRPERAVMAEKATFAAGCFWGVEETFRTTPGVIHTAVGYCNGKTEKPTYEDVCRHGTGHAEAVEVDFDPSKVTYEKLLDIFWHNHNPTTLNRQGPDVGDQYRSAIFYHNEYQKLAAQKSKDQMNKEHFKGKIVTQIEAAQTFWRAEEYHQQYLKKRGLDNCHI